MEWRFSMSFLLLISFLFTSKAIAQRSQSEALTIISGKVVHSKTGEPISGVTIVWVNTNKGAVSNDSGKFKIVIPQKQFPVVLELTSLGFEKKLLRLNVKDTEPIVTLEPQYSMLQEVVYAASRTSESILRSPVSIEKYGYKQLKEAAGVDLFENLRTLKGIEYISNGLTYKQVNTRGFSGTMNTRFLTLVDGADLQSPAIGWSFGNQYGITDIDLESAELIPGAASALYGPIAFNGLLSLHSKDPFKYQGLSIQMKTGINHINDSETGIHGYNDYAIRYATALSKKLAFKVNASYTNGLDWYANNYTDFSAQTPISQRGPNNPGRDAIHIYGDEVQKLITGIGLVSRTGYEDKYLSDYHVYNTKINGSIHYKIKPNLVLIASQLFGKGNSNYNGSSRYSTRDLAEYISKLELKGEDFFLRSYRVWENLGDYYNTRTLAQLINRSWVKDFSGNIVSRSMADQMWFTRYEDAYKGLINGVTPANHVIARTYADQGRLLPGTNEYEAIKSNIIKTYVPNGSRVFSKSAYYHTEGQYSFHDKLKTLDVIVGGNVRNFDLSTRETLLGDKDSKHIRLSEFGVFTQITKRLVDDKLRLTGSIRYDKNQNFKGKLTPRFSAVYQTSKDGFFRASFQTGFRNPTIVDQYVMLRSGATLLLGGVPENSNGMKIYENSFTSASVSNFTNAYNEAMAQGKTSQESLNASISLLKKANVPYISPEKQSAIEIGYKAELSHRFTIDINAYYSKYKNFIVNTVVQSVPTTILQNDGSINPISATDLIDGRGQLYQLYTNSDVNVSAFGFSSGITYYTVKKYQLSANATYSKLNTKEMNVNIYAPFNTPPWSTNLSLSNPDVIKHFGFNVNWHWQDTFLWYGTFLGNRPGPVHAFSMLDMQVSKKIPKKDILIKLGGSNVLNHRVAQVFGGPETGAIYYISILLGK